MPHQKSTQVTKRPRSKQTVPVPHTELSQDQKSDSVVGIPHTVPVPIFGVFCDGSFSALGCLVMGS
jgi:hypothetical protein